MKAFKDVATMVDNRVDKAYLRDIVVRFGKEVRTFTNALAAVIYLGDKELLSEACTAQATADAGVEQRCVMMQIEYLRPATEADDWAPVGAMLPVESLTCGDPTSVKYREFAHELLDEYFKYATHAPAFNRFWIGGAVCSHSNPEHRRASSTQGDGHP